MLVMGRAIYARPYHAVVLAARPGDHLDAVEALAIEPGNFCPKRHPTHCAPWSQNAIPRRGKQQLPGPTLTTVGMLRFMRSPCPSWPLSLRPQVNTRPSSAMTKQCAAALPPHTCEQGLHFATRGSISRLNSVLAKYIVHHTLFRLLPCHPP